VDVNRASFRPVVPITSGVVGDAAVVAEKFVELLDSAEVPPTGFRDRITSSATDADLMSDLPTQRHARLAADAGSIHHVAGTTSSRTPPLPRSMRTGGSAPETLPRWTTRAS